MFKAGRAVGKGVKYLTQLGSKIGKGLGSSVDKLGAGTRSTQAAAIKGVRGVRDAANSAGSAVREGADAARRGYNTGRNYDLHLGDVMPKPSSGGMRKKTLSEFVKTDLKGMIRNPSTMPGNKPSTAMRKSLPGVQSDSRFANSMSKAPRHSPGRPKVKYRGSHLNGKDSAMNKPNNYTIGPRYSDDVFAAREIAKNGSRMASKNRRAGIITLGAAGAGYGVHKGNEALQNHYQRQKNSSR